MYIRLVVTYCNAEDRVIPKEAHIDNKVEYFSYNKSILHNCIQILNKKLEAIKKMTPVHLKNKDFDFIVHGEYLIGYDWMAEFENWSDGEPIFNIQQLGVPEENRPIIKTS